jgi:GAF domain-containing protein
MVTAGSDDVALSCVGAQMEGGGLPAEGPVAQTLAEERPIVATLPEMQGQWPRLARVAARADIRRVLVVPISYGEELLGALSLYSAHPEAFGSAAQSMGPLVAVQAGVAISRIYREEHLQFAMHSRQHIGEAVGILVERHRILPGEAFQRLVKASQARNVKVREIADAVIQTGQDPEQIQLL